MIGDVLEMEWWWKWEDYAVDVAPQFALRLWAISPQQTTFIYALCAWTIVLFSI